jgi:protein required for attachment to host cells
MQKLKVPHDAFVVVSDGRKALFLRNVGDEKFPNLRTEQVFVEDNPPTHAQGADRPGRTFKRAKTNRRAAVQETDLHDRAERLFSQRMADEIGKLVHERQIAALVVAAPARALAELRRHLRADVQELIIAEIDKDLTNHPIFEIERHLIG